MEMKKRKSSQHARLVWRLGGLHWPILGGNWKESEDKKRYANGQACRQNDSQSVIQVDKSAGLLGQALELIIQFSNSV